MSEEKYSDLLVKINKFSKAPNMIENFLKIIDYERIVCDIINLINLVDDSNKCCRELRTLADELDDFRKSKIKNKWVDKIIITLLLKDNIMKEAYFEVINDITKNC